MKIAEPKSVAAAMKTATFNWAEGQMQEHLEAVKEFMTLKGLTCSVGTFDPSYEDASNMCTGAVVFALELFVEELCKVNPTNRTDEQLEIIRKFGEILDILRK